MYFEKPPKKDFLISNFQAISQIVFLDDYFDWDTEILYFYIE